MQTKITFTLS